MKYAAAGCTGSSKAPTHKNGGLNEDRFSIRHLPMNEQDRCLFVGVFDGHGGPGASSFLVDHFYTHLKDELVNKGASKDSLEVSLSNAFATSDKSLFRSIKKLSDAYSHLREQMCKCNFYLESPCRCLQAPRSAHEGSTGTVLIFTNERIYCANVGDSEAVLATRSGLVKSTSDLGCRDFGVTGTRSALSSDPPLPMPKAPPPPASTTGLSSPRMGTAATPASESEATPADTDVTGQDKQTDATNGEKDDLVTEVKSVTTSASSPLSPRFIVRKLETGSSTPYITPVVETMTIADTPFPDSLSEDYIRVKRIAETRVRRRASRTRSNTDGIRRGQSSRLNYVALEGAHSLNMTRAFGNFGHKVFDNETVVIEQESPIIARPHVNIFEPAYEDDFLFSVVASDGLWDNLCKQEVSNIVRSYCKNVINDKIPVDLGNTDKDQVCAPLHHTQRQRIDSLKVEGKYDEDPGNALLSRMAEGASEKLLSCALSRNRKLDDITVVVVLFHSVIAAAKENTL
mmetsp:Transcript_15442/g.25235  ORF Transcript_15442/g.25235 Transcript_15442/m.25235 type:complete len:515 (+) Transcript_15442:951-2495(+)